MKSLLIALVLAAQVIPAGPYDPKRDADRDIKDAVILAQKSGKRILNFSPENENRAVLSRYPAIPGYPHIFVLDTDGKLLHSQGTAELEEGQSYNLQRFTAFLEKWAPAKR